MFKSHTKAMILVLLLNLLVVRVVIWQLLLCPRENGLVKRMSASGERNLKMLSALLFTLCKLSLPRGARDIGMSWLRATLQEDFVATLKFTKELQRFCERGVPTLAGWMQESSAELARWTMSMLSAAREYTPGDGVGAGAGAEVSERRKSRAAPSSLIG